MNALAVTVSWRLRVFRWGESYYATHVLVISHPNLLVWGVKNEFSYYNTTPLITWPVVINPDHLLLCGLHAHTRCESISHNTYPVALPLPLTPTALNNVLSSSSPALLLPLGFLQFFFSCPLSPTHFPHPVYLSFDRTELRLLLRYRQLHLLLLPGKRGGA